MADLTVPLTKLLLDEQNPRHRAVTTQAAALEQILRKDPAKLLTLTTDIAAIGLSPIDRPIVMKAEDGKRYIVLEGNRRLVAMRLLKKPALCPDPRLRTKFETISTNASHRPERVRVYEVADREEARPLLDRRHGGEMNGIGVIRWSAMQRTRNSSSAGHQERLALATLDWLDAKSQSGANRDLADLLEAVAEDKFTTFGRLVGDPGFRAYGGFEVKGDIFTATDTTENVVLRLSMVLDDFRSARRLTVTELLSKDQRTTYINELRERMAGADESEDDDDDDAEQESDGGAGGQGGGADDTADTDSREGDGEADDREHEEEQEDPKPPPPPPVRLFHGASLAHCSPRVRSILSEVQKLPLQRYPNSAAACIRMVIELAVHEAHEKCGWSEPPEREKKLRAFVNNAIRELDPTMKAQRYLALRQELNKRDSIINTQTLNAFLHDPNYLPSAPVMKTISDTYSVLLNDLNRVIGEAKESGT